MCRWVIAARGRRTSAGTRTLHRAPGTRVSSAAAGKSATFCPARVGVLLGPARRLAVTRSERLGASNIARRRRGAGPGIGCSSEAAVTEGWRFLLAACSNMVLALLTRGAEQAQRAGPRGVASAASGRLWRTHGLPPVREW